MIDLKADNPCVFLSGGIDSMLVLSMAREVLPDIAIYCLNQSFTIEQWKIVENLIKAWDLEVKSFPPARTYLIPNGKRLAQVAEYNVNGVVIPILRDAVDGPKCYLERDQTILEQYPFEHDVVLVGSRREDNSFATGQPFGQQEIVRGGIRFVAPLFDWSTDEVMAEATKRDIPYSMEFYEEGKDEFDTGNLVCCVACLNSSDDRVFCPKEQAMIPTFQWNKPQALQHFRTRFGFGGNYAN